MRKVFLLFFVFFTVAGYSQKMDYPIQAVPFTQVHLNDNFWLPRIKTNHTVTIPASFERCENTGRVKNFEMAAAKSGKFCTVFPFDDMLLKSEAIAVKIKDNAVSTAQQPFVAIPYYAWAHRGKGEMEVWFPERITAIDIISK